MKRGSIWLVLGALVAVTGLLATTAAVAGTSQTPRRGGTAIFGADQEPGTLNVFVVGGDHLWASAAHYHTMMGWYVVTPRGTYRPELASKVTFTRRPMTV